MEEEAFGDDEENRHLMAAGRVKPIPRRSNASLFLASLV